MRPVQQAMTMAAIVATLLWLPVGGVLALLVYALAGVTLEGFVSFGGALNLFTGVMAWWVLAFAAALVYSAFAMPHN